MIRPEPRAPTRDDLAKQISFWNLDALKGGGEAAKKLFHGMEGEGATKEEIFKETAKHTDPKTETGIFRGAGDEPRFEMSDQDLQIKPGVNSFFNPKFGGSVEEPAGKLVTHPEMFSRDPKLAKIPMRLTMPVKDQPGDQPWPFMGSFSEPHANAPFGEISARARSDVRDPNSEASGSLLKLVAHELGGHAVADSQGFLRGDWPGHKQMQEAHQNLVHPRARTYIEELTNFKNSTGLSDAEWRRQYPDADQYLTEATRLAGPTARAGPQFSAASDRVRYGNVSGEEESNLTMDRLKMNADERRNGPDFPWLSFGAQAPYELQLLRTGPHDYRMKDDKDTLARLMQKRPL